MAPSDSLELADSVEVTFKVQKNDMKQDTVIHGQNNSVTLCPVVQWAHLVNRIWAYPCTTVDTPVCTIWCNGQLEQISSQHTMAVLRAACASVGSAKLGFEPSEVGTHSLRSGAAMETYLAGVPGYTIMLIGRWSSDVFLRCIWKQVEQFLKNVSKEMIQFCSFWAVPDIVPHVISN